jgi:hypothetical protein
MAKSRRTGLASRCCRCFLAIEVGFLGPSLRLIAIGLKNLRGHSISRIEMAAGDTTVGSRPCRRESRRWTVAELVERLKNLGVCASRASVTAALAKQSAFWLVYASGQHCLANTLRSKKRSYTTTANSKFWADPFIHFTRQRGDPLQYTTK